MRKVLNARDKRTRNTGKKKRRKRKHYEIDDRQQVQLKGELNSEVHRPEDMGRRIKREQERNKGTEKKEGKMVVIHRKRKTHIRYTATNEDGYVAEVRIEENGKNKRNKRKQD